MTENANEPYGLWPSPITPKSLSQGLRLSDVAWDSDGKTLVWLEGRGDRGVLVCSTLDANAPRDLNDELSVRARVGYGGGDFGVGRGQAFFCSGGRIYRQSLGGGKASAITPAFGQPASPTISPDGKWLLYVFSYENRDGLALVDAEGRLWPRKAAEGHDFFMQPRWSHDGRRAAWIAWDHPLMPWDGAQLFLAGVDDSGVSPVFEDASSIAGGNETAVFQPEFSPDGKYLSFLSDEGGWFNIYLYDLRKKTTHRLTDEGAAQLGSAAWVQGQRTYGWSHDAKTIYCVRNERGISQLMAYDAATGKGVPVEGLQAYTDFVQPLPSPTQSILAVVVSSSSQTSRVVVQPVPAKPKNSPTSTILKRATSESVPPEELIVPTAITWRGGDKEDIHGLLYSTRREELSGPPPAIIRIHGGPTSQSRAAYSADIQFFATRGYTVLDVNYRGSTGYGRDYMTALNAKWGLHDVADAVSGARFLAARGIADAERLVIMGGSAGGYTVLQAMITHPHFFKAGVCLYGVSNMLTLAAETHKFEARYLDSLIGPLPAAAATYRERSPIFHAEKIVDPLAVFQGEIDEVVPRAQSDAIVESLKQRGIPHEYHIYAGEGHGWRKTETIEAYYKAVENFLRQQVLFA